MKTKPHALIDADYMGVLQRKKYPSLWPLESDRAWLTGICLVKPTTCDKVRDWLMGFRQLGVPENVQAAELLKLLPECE